MTTGGRDGPETIEWTPRSQTDPGPGDDGPSTQDSAGMREAAPVPDPAIDLDTDPASEAGRPGGLRVGSALWLLVTGLGLIVTAAAGAAVSTAIAAVTAGNGVWAALAYAGLGVIGALVITLVLREIIGLARLGSLRGLRRRVDRARRPDAGADDTTAAVTGMIRMVRRRPDCAWGLADVEDARARGHSDAEILDRLETQVIQPLDRRCRRVVAAQARRAAAITAVSPFPALDMLATAMAALTMVSAIARIYGGRPGGLGAWRLAARAFAAVMASGAIDVTEDIVGDLVGSGLASKVSRRAGVGILNGLLVARLGRAAMEDCRPMPWSALPAPSARAMLRDALSRDLSGA